MSDPTAWATLESDPAVFTELCERVGVRGVDFEEVYSLDSETFSSFAISNQVLGFILLFKHDGIPGKKAPITEIPENLFFAKQIIADACASMAILSILMNRSKDVHIGSALENYREMAIGFDPETRGEAVSNLEVLRQAHNSFSCTPAFEVQKTRSRKNAKDQFHFVSYVPFADNGHVYELDGLRQGPIDCGSVSDLADAPEAAVLPDDRKWTELVRRAVQERIEEIMARGDELRFTLLAMVAAPHAEELHEREVVRTVLAAAEEAVGGNLPGGVKILDDACATWTTAQKSMFDTKYKPSFESEESAAMLLESCMEALDRLDARLKEEDRRRSQRQRENARRRHDFTPFALKALEILARKGKLQPAYAAAVAKE